ncbi:alginate export family protein [Parapedobacter deserti]|uniref:Alginate export family protein n=1 Tax=Parapedobacter deserti TaxID=1912957 RepID=A0ABV7JMJ4_9SPHI
MNLRYILGCVFLLSVSSQLLAQPFKLMRQDEDYTGLADSSRGIYNRLKYTPLSRDGRAYLSLGGEVRGEVDYALHEDWGEHGLGRDVFVLQRYHLHADLHLGNRVRVFGQLRSGLEDGRKRGPRGIDEDQLNVQNLFVDVVPFGRTGRTLTVRLGRQELRYGSGRLVDVRDGPNLRLYFDGAKVAYASPRLHVDAFVMADARVNTGAFDNTSNRKANLWGIYSTYITPKNLLFDFYYLGIHRADSRFNAGIADESRHTLGTRFWQDGIGFVYNFETGFQFGAFGTERIRAMALSSEVGYVFAHSKRLPAVKLRTDYISGDKASGDGTMGTFNAMYPNGGYFGMNPQAGPANLRSVHPNLTWNPTDPFIFTLDLVFYWRNSLNDGIYGPSGALTLSSSDAKKRYIGTAYMTTFSWHINDFLNYNIGVQYFKTGHFINDVIPQHKDGFFLGSVLAFKF